MSAKRTTVFDAFLLGAFSAMLYLMARALF